MMFSGCTILMRFGGIVPYKDLEKQRDCNRKCQRKRRESLREREKDAARARKWRARNPEKARAAVDRWNSNNWEKYLAHCRKNGIAMRQRLKLEVLTRYSPDRKLGCSWKPCNISDMDMLTLDHIADDGHSHFGPDGRKIVGEKLYRWAKKSGYPDSLQTLCANHQLKKAILLKKANRKP